jgi:hypothetical protein
VPRYREVHSYYARFNEQIEQDTRSQWRAINTSRAPASAGPHYDQAPRVG